MFTGIIEELGKIQNITSNKITIDCNSVIKDTKIGDSIAVNGVCLTVIDLNNNSFTANISPETFNITAFKYLNTNNFVNLERALKSDGRFGGHIVSGHIDGLGKILSINKTNDFYNLKIKLNQEQSKYVIKKGSITIDGISLTIANIDNNLIDIAIIPHTYENTNLKTLKNNDYVNIETDTIAKYVEKFLLTSDNKSRIDLKFLQEHGF